jgi:dGTPase
MTLVPPAPDPAQSGDRPLTLAHLAADPNRSRGRLHAEDERTNRGPRDAFQRDRDRIVHSIPFRRLRHKTQVFVAPDGDHYRVRLTHSLEVAQIARTLARALGLNEDLTEALALAHDIGHPPFGHAGEDVLKAAMAKAGGFDHNAHTIRLLTRLECPYPRFAGLNLSWETLEGLAKHNGPVAGPPPWALAEANAEFELELTGWPGLEAQIAAVADDIAYDNHDIDDGLRAGLFTLAELLDVPLVARAWAAVEARYPDLDRAGLVPELVRDLIGLMVNDVLAETKRRGAGIGSAEQVRAAGRPLAGFSAPLAADEAELKAFLLERMYEAPQVKPVRAEAQQLLSALFAFYRDDATRLPPEWRPASTDPLAVLRAVGDFIAGMTDRYAIRQYRETIGPIDLPEGF